MKFPKTNLFEFIFQIWEHLKKRKAIAFFVSDLPDASNKRLFQDCQIYVWAVHGEPLNLACELRHESFEINRLSTNLWISILVAWFVNLLGEQHSNFSLLHLSLIFLKAILFYLHKCGVASYPTAEFAMSLHCAPCCRTCV